MYMVPTHKYPHQDRCSGLHWLLVFCSVQVRWRNWRHCGLQASATMRRMRWWAASWTLITWRACSTCWLRLWPSASSPSSGSISSTGSCASASPACALTDQGYSSLSAGSVPQAAPSWYNSQVCNNTEVSENQAHTVYSWDIFISTKSSTYYLCQSSSYL